MRTGRARTERGAWDLGSCRPHRRLLADEFYWVPAHAHTLNLKLDLDPTRHHDPSRIGLIRRQPPGECPRGASAAELAGGLPPLINAAANVPGGRAFPSI